MRPHSCGDLTPDPCNCPMEDPTWNFWIGGDPHYRRFHGCIDEVKIFDGALTAEQVSSGSGGMGVGPHSVMLIRRHVLRS